jgi:predicted RNase H-like HicB family nuclease
MKVALSKPESARICGTEARDGAFVHSNIRERRCRTQSETVEEGVANIREAIGLYLESLVEDGLPIPTEDILIKPIEIPV